MDLGGDLAKKTMMVVSVPVTKPQLNLPRVRSLRFVLDVTKQRRYIHATTSEHFARAEKARAMREIDTLTKAKREDAADSEHKQT